MNRRFMLSLLLFLFLGTTRLAQSQTSPELDRVSEAIRQSVSEEMPSVRCRRGEPMRGSGNVLVEACFAGSNVLKLSVIPYASKELAKTHFRRFVALGSDMESTADVGEESYTWGFRKSDLTFRKDRFNVYIGIDDASAPNAVNIMKDFGKAVAKALKDL